LTIADVYSARIVYEAQQLPDGKLMIYLQHPETYEIHNIQNMTQITSKIE